MSNPLTTACRLAAQLIALAALAGCSALPLFQEALVLPTPTAVPCCWQSESHAVLTHREQHQPYTVVTARLPDRLTVVVLDPLGRRVLTVNHYLEGRIESQPHGKWQQLTAEQLLAAIYLLHTSADDWSLPAPWQMRATAAQQSLWYGEHVQLRVEPGLGAAPPVADTTLMLHFIAQQRVLRLTPKVVTRL